MLWLTWKNILSPFIAYFESGSVFSILGSGQVSVMGMLDRETLDNYKLIIEVEDNGTPTLTATTTLTITVEGEQLFVDIHYFDMSNYWNSFNGYYTCTPRFINTISVQ